MVLRRASLWIVFSLCFVLSACTGKKKEDPKPQTGGNNNQTNPQQTGGGLQGGGTPGQLPDGGQLLPPGAAQVTPANPPAQTNPAPSVQQFPQVQTPQQRLQDFMVAPPPVMQEAKPGLQRVLWLSLTGDGDRLKHEDDPVAKENHLKADIHIVQTPTLSRANEHPPTGRFISGPVNIVNHDGEKTQGYFEFRHPSRGVIEDFHAQSDRQKRTLEQITQAQLKVPHPFEIEIKIPLDKVTTDMVLTLDRAYQDLATREEELKKNPNDETTKRKHHEAFDRLQTHKVLIVRDLLNPAFEPWVKDFTCEPGKTPEDSGCMSESEIFDLRLEDQKAFFKFLDAPGNIEKLRDQFRAVTKNQALYERQLRAMNPGDSVPALPPPPKYDEGIANSSDDTVVLATEGVPRASLAQPNRVKVALIAEGFTASQKAKFFKEAQQKWDYLMGGGESKEEGVEPFKSYRSYFVGVAIFVPSNQEGACHPSSGKPCPDTVFKSSYDTLGMDRLLSMPAQSNDKVKKLLMAKLPDAKLAALLVNDTQYGGAGGAYALASLHNPMGGETLAHELMGHTFAHLGDEYEADYSSYPDKEEPNTTMDDKGNKADFWRTLMKEASSKTPEKTWDADLLASPVVEGAHYHRTGWWRPLRMCKMRALGANKPFCPVCHETIIREIYGKVSAVDLVTYAGLKNKNDTELEAQGTSWSIEIKTLIPQPPPKPGQTASTNPIEIIWSYVPKNGQEQVLQGALNAKLEGSALASLERGEYKLRAHVKDVNPTVFPIAGVSNPLESVREWKLKLKK